MDRGRGICLFDITVLSSHWLINGTTYPIVIVVEVIVCYHKAINGSEVTSWIGVGTAHILRSSSQIIVSSFPEKWWTWRRNDMETLYTSLVLHEGNPRRPMIPFTKSHALDGMMTSSSGNISTLLTLCEFVNSPHTGQWRGALKFSLICAWTNVWVNNRDTGN